ncbi:hypothetical protein O7631_17725 [Micromonospora sp. WMMD967]|uniref:hypothetical protein n=1 Tax=Micromonospora sp. WMMD967 TaxID=3016101 RepID=UPI0024169B29|nr:hypothetical protein [Micromonospora sp. WMMD967]MDG4838362.1 hypothetical protein [Micromonospora sp. WMMD967]
MTRGSPADWASALHAETAAAIEQRAALAVAARCALIDALRSRLICRPGCEDALATWGLDPLPQRWTISAGAQLSYTRSHTNDDEAREQARWGVPDDLRLLQPAIAVYPQHVIDVAPAPEADDEPGPQPYRITVQVMLQTWATAVRETDAHDATRTTMDAHLRALAEAGITLSRLTWQSVDSPDEALPDDVDTDVGPLVGAVMLTAVDGFAAATAARDRALQALADLRRSIRARSIRALVDDEFGGNYQHAAQRVNQFLVDLGLDPLPQAHHVTVIADLTLPVGDGTSDDACDAARHRMRAVTTINPDEARPWTAYGWTIPENATADQDGWRMPWQHEYEMWLRGHATPADATTAAEALVRADLTRALAGIDHNLVTVTSSVEGHGIDFYLDPDSD